MERKINILGCGLSGMLTALFLAKHQFQVTILENRFINSDFFNDIRTTALTPKSVEFLKDINVWEALKEKVGFMYNIYVVDNKSKDFLEFQDKKHLEPLGCVIKNIDFKRALFRRVRQDSSITLIHNFSYKNIEIYDNSVSIISHDNNIYSSTLLILCDGYKSRIRNLYFSSRIDKTYHQVALSFNVRHAKNHENCAMEHFISSGPFAILPLAEQNESSVIWTLSQKTSSVLMNLSTKEFESFLNINCGFSLGEVKVNSIIKSFPLRGYITNNYFYKRIVLLADTAHVIHPLAGQGLNQGIKDIQHLIYYLNKHGSTNKALSKYQASREKDNLVMFFLTDTLNGVFSSKSATLLRIRRLGLNLLEESMVIKNLILNYAMGNH